MWLQGDYGAEVNILAAQVVYQLTLLFLWYRRTSEHYLGVDWRHFFILPFGSLTISALYLHSAYLVHSGVKVSWKGRQYTVNTSKAIQDGKEGKAAAALDPALTAVAEND